MAQPIWITPAGSLGVIPEGVFYQQPMLATVDPLPVTVTVTSSSSETNLFTCNSTDQIYEGLNVTFKCGNIPSRLEHVNLFVTLDDAVTVGVFGNTGVEPSKVC